MNDLKQISLEDFDLDTKFSSDDEILGANGFGGAEVISATWTFLTSDLAYNACKTSTGWVQPTNMSELCQTSDTR